jgi:hypothetical protein
LRILSVTEEEYDDGLFSYRRRHTDTLRLTGTWRPVVTFKYTHWQLAPRPLFKPGSCLEKLMFQHLH